MNRTQQSPDRSAVLPAEDGGFVLCPIVMTEEELIQFLRIPEISSTGDYRKWSVYKGRSPLSKSCQHFNKIRKLAGIETGTFHDLRRTCLSKWVAQGLSLHEVKELAGHAKIETTERFYLAVRKDVVNRARAASDLTWSCTIRSVL